MIFDRALIRARQDRARRLGPATFLLERVAQELADRLSVVVRHFDVAVDLGTPAADLRRALANNPAVGQLIAASRAVEGASLAVIACFNSAKPLDGSHGTCIGRILVRIK